MELYAEHHARPNGADGARYSHLSERNSFGVMELAENQASVRYEQSFDKFVPSQYLIDGWMLVVEGRRESTSAS